MLREIERDEIDKQVNEEIDEQINEEIDKQVICYKIFCTSINTSNARYKKEHPRICHTHCSAKICGGLSECV